MIQKRLYEKNSSKNVITNNIIFLILIFLISLNFLNILYYLFISIMFVFFILNRGNKIYFSFIFTVLLIFSILFTIFVFERFYININSNAIIKIFLYPMAFFLGENIIKDKDEKPIIKIIILTVFGMSLHGLLNFFMNLNEFGFFATTRAFPDFWTQEIWTATAQATVFSALIGVFFYCLFLQKKRSLKFFILLLYCFAFLYSLMLSGRSFLVLSVIVFFICLISYWFIRQDNVVQKRKVLKSVLISILVLFFVSLIMFLFNILNLRENLLNSGLFSRLDNDNLGFVDYSRINLRLYYYDNMLKYLWGGLNIRAQAGYAHSLWLDLYDSAGVITYLCLMFYTFLIIIQLIKVVVNKNICANFKVLIIGLYSVLFIQFLLEPILDGVPWLFIMMCLYNGMINKYLKNINNN